MAVSFFYGRLYRRRQRMRAATFTIPAENAAFMDINAGTKNSGAPEGNVFQRWEAKQKRYRKCRKQDARRRPAGLSASPPSEAGAARCRERGGRMRRPRS